MASSDQRHIKTKLALTGGACMGCLAEPAELTTSNTTLEACGRCRRAFYCSTDCRRVDHSIHKTVCTALAGVNAHMAAAGRARMPDGGDPRAGQPPGPWDVMSLPVVSAAGVVFGAALGRPPGFKEREYLLYEPRCLVCHVPGALLPADSFSRCPDCRLVVACTGEHAATMAATHTGGETCGMLALVRDTELITIRDAQQKESGGATAGGLIQPHAWMPDTLVEEPWEALPTDGWPGYFSWRKAPAFVPAFLVAASDLLSVPLTILHAVMGALGGSAAAVHDRTSLTVHLVGVSDYELRALFAREELLHLLPGLKTLRLALFSPEGVFPPGPPRVVGADAICDTCVAAGRSAPVLLVGGAYATAGLPGDYEEPVVVVGLNSGIHNAAAADSNREEWASTIATIAARRTPLVLTSYTGEEAAEDAVALTQMLADVDGYGLVEGPAINPWGSARPYVDMGYSEFYFNSHSYLMAGPTGGS
ncbi:hypothetical protein MMPV_001251 [Pyropia vietnamensis]